MSDYEIMVAFAIAGWAAFGAVSFILVRVLKGSRRDPKNTKGHTGG
jgi:hypothetical protein